MTAEQPLRGQRVLVTRPAHQAAEQIRRLRTLGAESVALPLLQIEPIPASDPGFAAVKQCILDLDCYHAVIFISPNAARLGAELIDDYWPQLPLGVHWLAIGASTADTLRDYGIEALHSPLGYDSEALLQAAPLQQVTDRRILILRGRGGRDKLAETLETRGATIHYADLYRRVLPDYSGELLKNTIYAKPLSAILITSGESLQNLIRLATSVDKAAGLATLQQCRLIVPSPRISTIAIEAGFKRIILASGPDDRSMVGALLNINDSEPDL